MVDDNTPLLIGAGQFSERPGTDGYRQLSPTDLAAEAARAACDDALSATALVPHIDAIFAVRTVGDSVPAMMKASAAPFGGPDNVPGAVAARLGATPAVSVYSPACGDEPQKLLGEACERLHAGEFKLALLCGGEAISTTRAARSAGQVLDWNEHVAAPFDDRSTNPVQRSRHMMDHLSLIHI